MQQSRTSQVVKPDYHSYHKTTVQSHRSSHLTSSSSIAGHQTRVMISAPKPGLTQPKVVLPQPKIVSQPKVQVVNVAPNLDIAKRSDSSQSPALNQIWILNVQGLEFNPKQYKKLNDKSVVMNIQRLDKTEGDYHYVQAARWTGSHVDQAVINARTATLMTLIGLDILENGYVNTHFGPTIMVLGGNGHILDLPAHPVELVITSAGRKQSASKPAKAVPGKQIKAKTLIDVNRSGKPEATNHKHSNKHQIAKIKHRHSPVHATHKKVSANSYLSKKHQTTHKQNRLTHRTHKLNSQHQTAKAFHRTSVAPTDKGATNKLVTVGSSKPYCDMHDALLAAITKM